MGRTRDEMLQAAEAEVRRVHDVLLKLEAGRASAMERVDQIADEPFDTQEQAAEISRRVEIADHEVARIQEEIAEAEDDWRRAQADFDYYSSGAGDDDEDSDGDSGETLSAQDAADIWRSNGIDEDYRFGYTEDELRRAAEEQPQAGSNAPSQSPDLSSRARIARLLH
jgi:chromosome segregation ATPase